jgi:hypothetical protein
VEVVSKATEAQLETLRHKVATLTQQRDALSQQADALGAQARAAALHHSEEEARERQIRAAWRSNTATVLQDLSHLLIQWPAPLDAYHFEEEDWVRLSQVEAHVQRLQEACVRLHETVERTITAL